MAISQRMSVFCTVELDFAEDFLFGRETELASLRDAYTQAKTGSSPVMTLIHGDAGTGKTSLAKKLAEVVNMDETESFCVTATCQPPSHCQQHRLYHPMTKALTQLCEQVLGADDMLFLSDRMDESVSGEEREALLQIVPKWGDLLGQARIEELPSSQELAMINLKTLTKALKTILRVICNHKHPVVFILEDFHNIDAASLALLESFLRNTRQKNFLLAVTYREKEERQHDGTATTAPTAPAKILERSMVEKGSTMSITNIHVTSFDKEKTNDYIATLLEEEPSIVKPFSNVVHYKTMGNIFHIIAFLKLLRQKKLLAFDLSVMKWQYDLDGVIAETDVCENVVDLISGRMDDLPKDAQEVLKLAACLGLRVDIGLLSQVLESGEERRKGNGEKGPTNNLAENLDLVEGKGLLERTSLSHYKFAHHLIQENAYALLRDEPEKARLHFCLGEILHLDLKDGDVDSEKLFHVADHFNRALPYIHDEQKKHELAGLNLQAGKCAMAISAFIPAAKYFQAGLSLLTCRGRWEKHYELMLQLSTLSAEAEYSSGNFRQSTAIAREVLAFGATLHDTIAAQVTIVQALGAQKKFVEALRLGIQVIQALGEKFPRIVSTPRLMAEMVKTKRDLRKYTDEELVCLPLLQDRNKVAVMKIVSELCMSALCTSRYGWLSFVSLKLITMTLKYGVCKESACAFVTYGALLCGPLNDLEQGARFGRLAERILARFNALELKTRVYFWAYSCINHWARPLTECHDPLLEAYRNGMACGDINYALQSAGFYCVSYVYSGLPLEPIESDIRSYCSEMVTYKQETALILAQTTWQFVLNLMGRSSRPVELSGEAMDYRKTLQDAISTENRLAAAHLRLMRMALAYYLGDMKLAEMMAKIQRQERRTYQSLYEVVINEFFLGLISIALSRNERTRRHLRQARRRINRMKMWAKTNGNCLHMLALLNAEYIAVKDKGKGPDIKQAFDAAIAMAGRSGFLHDKALACERAGVFFFHASDFDWASHYLSMAYELFSEWGARTKCDLLRVRFASLLAPQEHRSNNSINHRGRRRFSGRSSSSHRRISLASIRRSSEGSLSLSVGPVRRVSGTASSVASHGEGGWRRPGDSDDDGITTKPNGGDDDAPS